MVMRVFRLAGESPFFACPKKRNPKKGHPQPSWPAASLRYSVLSAPAELVAMLLRLGAPNIPRLNRSTPALLDSLEGGRKAGARSPVGLGCL